MSITFNYAAGRKGGNKRVSASPTHSNHQSPTSLPAALPKIKLNIRPNQSHPSRPDSSSSSRSRAGPSIQRRGIFDDDSSSDLTPPEDDDDDDDQVSNVQDEDDTEDDFPMIKTVPRKKQRESLSHATPTSIPRDKTKAKAVSVSKNNNNTTNINKAPHIPFSSPRPTTTGPNGRERKRIIRLGEVARRRARDDKFGFGGADRFGGATQTQSRIVSNSSTLMDSDSTSSFGDDESEREGQSGLDDDETDDDEFMGTLPEALAGQEIEDLAYGGGPVELGMEDEGEQEWWQEQEDDEDFIANLTGSDIEALQSQSSVAASDSDDPMTSSTDETESDDAMDEFGFPRPFHEANDEQPTSTVPLVLMENWDGQFVLVQPRTERSRSRRNRDSQTNGSVGDSTSLSAGEQHLMIDADANEDTDESDWSGIEDDDGGDTTDSMAEEDMPVLDSPALDEIIGQQLATNYVNGLPPAASLDSLTGTSLNALPGSSLDGIDFFSNPAIVVTDTTVETPSLSTTTSASAVPSPVASTSTPPTTAGLPTSDPATPIAPLAVAPVMGTFIVSQEPCAHAVIDGSKATTKSPFTRRRRNGKPSDASSVTSKRRSHMAADPLSPMIKKIRFSSIPGHPRYIAARRAVQPLVDPMDRENENTTSDEDDNGAFSLEDMLDASVLHVNEGASAAATSGTGQPEMRHLFRFDKVPVAMYMRRNFASNHHSSAAMPQGPSSPSASTSANAWHSNYSAPPGLAASHSNLTDTLADTLAGPASRLLISPLLAPMASSEADDMTPMSRKERRKARRGRGVEMLPLQI